MAEHLLVIGGGVIGLSCAYELRKRGYEVSVVEKEGCGGQASGAAAGMLAPFSENSEQPDAFFELCLDSLRLYEDWQQEIREVSGMEFEYSRTGSLYVYFHEADRLAMESRRLWQMPYGADAEIVTGEELFRLEPELSREARGALYYPHETHVYAPHYVKALEQACRNIGVHIRDFAGAISMAEGYLETDSNTDFAQGVHVQVTLASGEIMQGNRLVLCTGAWSQQWEAAWGVKVPVYPIRGQICAYETAYVGEVRHMVFCSQGYVVGKANGSLVCGASEDVAGFDTTVTAKGLARLESWNGKLLPALSERTPFHQWAGLRPATQDGWPLIGTVPQSKAVLFAVGHYRNGILLSPATAKLIADIADGRPTYYSEGKWKQYVKSFAPNRFA
jgi:glycine oxidase